MKKKVFYIILIILLATAAVFLAKDCKKNELLLNNLLQSKENVIKGDSKENKQEALNLFQSAAEHLKDDALLQLRILYSKWPEIEKRYFEIVRAVQVEKEDVIILDKKLEELKILVEEVEKGTEEVLSLENLTPEEKWKAHNLMGCVKLWKTLFVQGDNQETINKRIQGVLRESIHSFKQAINTIEQHNLTGIPTDIPRRNLELLLKRNEESSKQSQSEEGEQREKGKNKVLQKVMPILGGPPETGGEK